MIQAENQVTYQIIPISGQADDISGNQFGDLVAIAPVERKGKNIMWLCICLCGSDVLINPHNIKTTKSCGCRSVHGHYGTSEYIAWSAAKQRCFNSKNPRYKNYGGRGISMCSKWKESFIKFITDMGVKPSPDLTLERLDNDGNYEPANCVWATRLEQQRNTRFNRIITFNKRSLCLSEWAEIYKLNVGTLYSRFLHGWSIERVRLVNNRMGGILVSMEFYHGQVCGSSEVGSEAVASPP